MDHVRGLLRQAGVIDADETPARAAKGLNGVAANSTRSDSSSQPDRGSRPRPHLRNSRPNSYV